MLFDENKKVQEKQTVEVPLAERTRPVSFDSVLGQDKIWGKNGPLRKLVEADRFFSLIFWGPPGTGKTTVAHLICSHSKRILHELSSVSAGVKDIRKVLDLSSADVRSGAKAHILFMDEVHRLSKNQQDVLLPSLEKGEIRFIGATTENPSFEVNHAVNSRSLVFQFQRIPEEEMVKVFKGIIEEKREGLSVEVELLERLARASSGDFRRGLNLVEALLTVCEGKQEIKSDDLGDFLDSLPLVFDKKGDQHYDTASALIKSIRASQPDAAIYYLARMLEGGEDPEFIARRLIISASEDIGMAYPHALTMATSAAGAVKMIGMPEARIILAQICTFLAKSPKSNESYLAINKAGALVKKTGALKIPLSLCNAPTKMMKEFGYSEGYVYAHDDPEGAKKMEYLPEEIKGTRFFGK